MNLPKMSTTKPRFKSRKLPEFTSDNLLKQEFNPKALNQVWTTDFTYISIGHKRHVYLCAILDSANNGLTPNQKEMEIKFYLKHLSSLLLAQLAWHLLLHSTILYSLASTFQYFLDFEKMPCQNQ